ncbi:MULTISPECIES: hypothetical protein [Tsukamurella]|uniref:Uncharacterized protein n=1 Tax=Tsukamurella asaccharolytica TaxID=2592067 RepID=A0A5C5R6H1_9ACTN|nr:MULTISPECIES: hypothetical protein [Tsukamurella]TWS17775.1 hypothetical protein FK529_18960 [Tsukamurella asaccharolytica]
MRTEMAPHPIENEQHPESAGDTPQPIDYGNAEQYFGKAAVDVALELFGDDLTRPGVLYSEAGSDFDVPYKIICTGNGNLMTYNMLDGKDAPAGSSGLDGYVISHAKAERLAHIVMDYTPPFSTDSATRSDTER